MGEPSAIDAILPFLNNKYEDTKLEVGIALLQLGDDRGFNALCSIANGIRYYTNTNSYNDDYQIYIQQKALKALCTVKDSRAIDVFMKALHCGYAPLQDAGMFGLVNLGREATNSVISKLKSRSSYSHLLCEVIGKIGDKKAIPILIERLLEDDVVQNAAYQALWRIDGNWPETLTAVELLPTFLKVLINSHNARLDMADPMDLNAVGHFMFRTKLVDIITEIVLRNDIDYSSINSQLENILDKETRTDCNYEFLNKVHKLKKRIAKISK